MSRMFSYDGPLMTFIGKIADLLILNVIWLLCCIPIITIGPATTAMYYVTLKLARNEEPSIVKSFFHSFKMNLKQGIFMFLALVLIGAVLVLDYFIMGGIVTGTFGKVFRIILVLWLIAYAATTIYAYPLLAQFDNTVFGTLKNAFMLSIGRFPTSILLLLLHAIPPVCFLLSADLFMRTLPLWAFLAPVVIARASSEKHKKIFDQMMGKTEEDIPTEPATEQE